MPPSSWKLIATVLSMVRTKTSAPTFTSSETSLETLVSCVGRRVRLDEVLVDVAGEEVRRGDRHDGRRAPARRCRSRRRPRPRTSRGTCSRTAAGSPAGRCSTLTPAAIAMKPSSASRPSISEYSGRIVVLRRITLRLRLESVAVIECGYMNSASAEPSASVAYAHWPARAGGERAVRHARRRVLLRERVARLGEDVVEAAQLDRDVDDRHRDDDVDQAVLDEGDQRGRPQPGGVGVRGEHARRRSAAAGP